MVLFKYLLLFFFLGLVSDFLSLDFSMQGQLVCILTEPSARLGYPPSAAVGDTAHFLPAPLPRGGLGMMAGQEEGASGRLRTVFLLF